MNGGKITFTGPPVDEVTPEDIANALERFMETYLCCPMSGPYRDGDNSVLGVSWAIADLTGDTSFRDEYVRPWMDDLPY